MHKQSPSRFRSRPGRAGPPRAGYSLIELTIAGLLLGTAMGLIAPSLIWVARERRAAERRQEALQEVQNILERLTAQPWESVTSEAAGRIRLDERLSSQLPEARLTVEVSMLPDDPDAKRLFVELRWVNGPGKNAAPVRLTAWIYRRGGAAP
jgi:hypothetical protein